MAIPKSDYQKRKEKEKREREQRAKRAIKKVKGIIRGKKPRRPKRPRKTRAKVKKPQSMTKWKEGRLIGTSADVEAVGMVVSPRGRDLARPTPGMEPSAAMPQTQQDFFFTSRAIRTMAYDYKKHILQIQWQSGDVYNYYDVPELIWIALKNASSKGRYVYYNIRTSYRYTRVK